MSQRTAEIRHVEASSGMGSGTQVDLGPLGLPASNYLRARPDLVPHLEKWIVSPAEPGDMVPFSVVRNLVAEDLSQEVESAYSWIDPVPIRRGALTQLHLARTVGGREVVLKLRRPDAREFVSQEFPALARSIDVLAKSVGLSAVEGVELKQGLRDWLEKDVDATSELTNLERLHASDSGQSAFTIPTPRADLCGPRLVVFEVPRGVPIREVIRLFSDRNPDQFARLDLDSVALGNNLVRSVLHQIFIAENYISSLDPENLIALPDDRVSFLDFSHVDRIDPVIRRNQFRYLAAIAATDVDRLLIGITELAESPHHEAIEAFGASFRERSREWERDQPFEGTPAELLADHLQETLRLARKHNLRFSDSVLTVVRTTIRADVLAKQLSPRSGLGAVAPAFFSSRWLTDFVHELWRERLPTLGFDVADLLTDSPGNVVRILSDLAERRFVLRVQTVESEESRVAAANRARLLGISGLFVGASAVGAALLLSTQNSAPAWYTVVGLSLPVLVAFGVVWRRLG